WRRKARRAHQLPRWRRRKKNRRKRKRRRPPPLKRHPQQSQRQEKPWLAKPPANKEKFRDAADGRASNQKQRPVPRLRDVILRKLPKAAHERKIKWRIQIQSWSNSAA